MTAMYSRRPGGMRLLSQPIELADDHRARAEQILRLTAESVDRDSDHEAFVALATAVTSDGRRSTSTTTRARLALAYVQRLKYVWDPLGKERIQSPRATVARGAGDCNSLVGLLAALLAAVGIESRLVLSKTSPGAAEWGHIWLEVAIGQYWVSADPSPMNPGTTAQYLPLGRAPIMPIEPLRLDATDPKGTVQGIFDVVGDIFEGLRDFVVNVATLKYFMKGSAWAWSHMGADMRQLVMVIGPIAAGVYGGPMGAKAAQAALQLLENRRLTKQQRQAAQRQLVEAREAGILPAWFEADNQEHIEAAWLAANMPETEKAAWLKSHGIATPAAQRKSSNAKKLLPVAALVALPFLFG